MKDMNKVMIIDDEILAIEDLLNLIPWQQYGFEVVATATNSQKALELYEQHRPQIIFVDIRMPIMDGLEFSQKINSYGHPVKIILLTAFKEFEYAKRAVEIGVANYLLKHDLNEESLIVELRKVSSELEDEKNKNFIIRQQFIKQTLEGEPLGNWTKFKGVMLPRIEQENLGLLLVEPEAPFLVEFNTRKLFITEPDFKSITLPEDIHWVEMFILDEYRMAIIIGIKKFNSQSEEREKLYQVALIIQKLLGEEYREQFFFVITRTCYRMEELSSLYQKAAKAIEFKIFFEREQIFYTEDLPIINVLTEINLDLPLKKLAQSLQESNDTQISEQIRELFGQFISQSNPRGLKMIGHELLYVLEHYRKNYQLVSLIELFSQGKIDTKSLHYASDIQNWFCEQFSLAIRQVLDTQLKYSKKVQQIIQYIKRHYAEDLAVDDIAEALGISGVYLSQIFKKETNQTFLEYLTEYRIASAKEILSKGDYKVYEVAEMVGYKTSQYFSQVFKKITGVYPLDFRERGNKNETRD